MKFITASTLLTFGHCSQETWDATHFSKRRLNGGGVAGSIRAPASRVSRYTKREVVKPIESTTITDQDATGDIGVLPKEYDRRLLQSIVRTNGLTIRPILNSLAFNSSEPIIEASFVGGGSYNPTTNNMPRATECTAGYVTCNNGYEVDDNGEVNYDLRCKDACGTECCVGEFTNDEGITFNACDGFSGRVCRDSYSCSGDLSCFNARIGAVFNSCNGDGACAYAAATPGSNIGNIHNSCNGLRACVRAADYGGYITGIVDSCPSAYSCGYIASGAPGQDIALHSMGMVIDSCSEFKSCMYAGINGGSIGDITSSCKSKNACFGLGSFHGSVGNIYSSCLGDASCEAVASNKGSMGYLDAGCGGEFSCSNAASGGGLIDGIYMACNEARSCDSAAINAIIAQEIINCCNEEAQCQDITSFEETDCHGDRPTPLLTVAPTGEPTIGAKDTPVDAATPKPTSKPITKPPPTVLSPKTSEPTTNPSISPVTPKPISPSLSLNLSEDPSVLSFGGASSVGGGALAGVHTKSSKSKSSKSKLL